MDIVVFPRQELPVVLGALCAFASVRSEQALKLLKTLAKLHGSSLEAEGLVVPTHEFVREKVSDPQRRKRLVQLAIVMALVDGQASLDAAYGVADLARALEVEEPSVATLFKVARGKVLGVRIDVGRRVFARILGAAWREQGLRGAREILGALRGVNEDRATAARYAKLAHYPAHTLGHALFAHCAQLGLSLPGQRGAIPERALFHDIGHLLSGYGTDPHGELLQAAFQAGFVRQDGFAFLLFGILQFHVGIKLTPIAEPARGCFDAETALVALARGAACRVDLSDHWNFWDWAAKPLKTVREIMCVPARVG